ncbi:MAG: S-adenosyl-l-methionine hydroxide adenosyltransferase family protein [Nitrospinota bacterium]
MSAELPRPEDFEEGGAELAREPAPRPVVTLTSDFGLTEPFIAMMKGVILGINPEVQLVDLSHDVPPFDIFGAAVLLHSAYHFFPRGTIHVVVVDPGVGGDRRPILAATENYFFVGPDNGVFSFIYEDPAFQWVRHVTAVDYFMTKVSATFHGRDVFAPVAGYLSAGVEPRQFGPKIGDFVRIPLKKPELDPDGTVHGEIVYVDRFGNLITNIETETFWEAESVAGGTCPVLQVGDITIRALVGSYLEAAPGEPAMLFNSWKHLEVFIPTQNAAERMGFGVGAPLVVTFEREPEGEAA